MGKDTKEITLENYQEKLAVDTNVTVKLDKCDEYKVRPRDVGSVVEVLADGMLKVRFKKKKRDMDVTYEHLVRVEDSDNPQPDACENCSGLLREKQNLMDKIAQLKAQLQCTNCAAKEEEDEALLKQIDELKAKQKEIIEKCEVHPKLQEETQQLKDQVQSLESQLHERETYRKGLQQKIKSITTENEQLKEEIMQAKQARDTKLQTMRVQFRENAKNFKKQKNALMLEAQKLENQKSQLEVELKHMNADLASKKTQVKETVSRLMIEIAKYPVDNINADLSAEAVALREKIQEIRDRAKKLETVKVELDF